MPAGRPVDISLGLMREIQMKDAKARLSAVVDDAVRGEEVGRHGRKEPVVVSRETWRRPSNVASLSRLLAAGPLDDSDLAQRDRSPLRDVGLEIPARYERHFGARADQGRRAGCADGLARSRLGQSVRGGGHGGGNLCRDRQGGAARATRKAEVLALWCDAVEPLYGDRVPPLDLKAATIAGRLSDRAARKGARLRRHRDRGRSPRRTRSCCCRGTRATSGQSRSVINPFDAPPE